MTVSTWRLDFTLKFARVLGACTVALWLGLAVCCPSIAAAAGDDPILVTTADGNEMEFATADGTATSSLTITNPGDNPLPLSIVGRGNLEESCPSEQWTLTPETIEPHTTVSVEVSAKCAIPQSPATGQVALLDATTEKEIAEFSVTSAPSTPTVDLTWILRVFVWALLVAAAAVVAIFVLATRKDGKPQKKEWPKPGTVTVSPWDEEKNSFNAEYIHCRSITALDELPGVDAKWSLADSWATSLSTLATLFVALLGNSGGLAAILGAEPAAFLAYVLVAGVVAAFLTGSAPLVTKAVGKSTKVCVAGLLLGGLLTMAGVAGQLYVLGRQFSLLPIAEPGWIDFLPWLLAGLMVVYGFRTLRLLLKDAFEKEQVPNISPITLDQAAIIAAGTIEPPAIPTAVLEKAREIRKILALTAVNVKVDPKDVDPKDVAEKVKAVEDAQAELDALGSAERAEGPKEAQAKLEEAKRALTAAQEEWEYQPLDWRPAEGDVPTRGSAIL